MVPIFSYRKVLCKYQQPGWNKEGKELASEQCLHSKHTIFALVFLSRVEIKDSF